MRYIKSARYIFTMHNTKTGVSFAKQPYKRNYIHYIYIKSARYISTMHNTKTEVTFAKEPYKRNYIHYIYIKSARYISTMHNTKTEVSFAKEPYKRNYIHYAQYKDSRVDSWDNLSNRKIKAKSTLRNSQKSARCIFTMHHTRTAELTRETMRRLRLVGSLKTWVSFAKEHYSRDYILQKRPLFSRSLLIIATPYLSIPKTKAKSTLTTS